jgi:formylglycine-generating enzyme required for sulfatase activity
VADIFISYSKQQPQPSRDVAAYLESEGYSVWWDTNLTSGERFGVVIDRELDAAKAVIVIWTAGSVSSDWVISEAQHAARQEKLIPLRTNDLDIWRIPKPYSALHTDVVDDRPAILAAVRRVVAHAEVWKEAHKGDRGMPDKTGLRGLSHEPAIQSTTPPQPGTTFRDIDMSPEMVVIPAGEFMMGSPEGKGDADERPRHKVDIALPFAVGRFAVTFDEWDAAVAAKGVKHTPGDAGWGRGRRPVINVSWQDGQAYVRWLSQETGKSYRLLSEAEWEYCCRGGTITEYSFGDKLSKKQSQFLQDLFCKTAEVGGFPANGWGLHDMHGNVWEWCEDSWHNNYEGAPEDGSAWRGGVQSLRVLRGGSWGSGPQVLRSANRYRYYPDSRDSYIGFRVARTL